jgi:hypothetical protein
MAKPINPQSLEIASRRLTGLQYINPNLNFGSGLSVENFAAQTEAMRAKVAEHNELLARLDSNRAEVKAMSRSLNTLSGRILNTIAAIHGTDSDEYEMVGGKKRTFKKAPIATPQNPEVALTPDSSELLKAELLKTEAIAPASKSKGKS